MRLFAWDIVGVCVCVLRAREVRTHREYNEAMGKVYKARASGQNASNFPDEFLASFLPFNFALSRGNAKEKRGYLGHFQYPVAASNKA